MPFRVKGINCFSRINLSGTRQMCDQCLCGFKEFGEVVPGWDLLQANEDGIVVKQGNWVLARRITSDGKPQYELAYTWNRAPLADPFKGDSMAWGKAMDEVPGKEGERVRSEEHTSELQSRLHLVCRLLL